MLLFLQPEDQDYVMRSINDEDVEMRDVEDEDEDEDEVKLALDPDEGWRLHFRLKTAESSPLIKLRT